VCVLDWYNSHLCLVAGCGYLAGKPSDSLEGTNFLTSSMSASLSGMVLFRVITVRSHGTGLCVVFMMHTDDQAMETLLHVYPYLAGRKYNLKAPVHVFSATTLSQKHVKLLMFACSCKSHVCQILCSSFRAS
jgi:hypothetical protein